MGDYKTIYRAASFAAICVLILMPVQVAVFVAFPLPTTVAEWFALFQRNPIAGLLDMDLLLIVDYVLLAVVFLGLWAALHPASPSLSALAALFEFLAVSAYFASTTALEMLALSDAYAAAATDAERTAIAAAGQALLATWDGTAFTFSYELSAVAVLLAGMAMLRSKHFARTGAYAGVATGVLSIVPANAGTIGLVLSIVALVPTAIWLSLVSRDLLRLSRVS